MSDKPPFNRPQNPPDIERPQEEPPREAVERLILEVLLIQHADRINEGNNGIIFSLRLSDLNKEALGILTRLGVISPEEDVSRVVKLLKIGSPGKLKKEYDLSAKACATIKPKIAGKPHEFADIPQPRYYDTLKVTPFFQESFQTQHDIQVAGGEIEIMVMDRVEGTDVDTILLREFLRRNPNSPLLKQPKRIDTLSFEDLEGVSMSCLGFKKLTGKKRSQWSDADWLEYMRFRKEMEEYLHKSDFRIDMSLLDGVERTIHTLYDEAGVAWGDGNLRNIMLEGAYDPVSGEAGEARSWVIDFGGAEFGNEADDPAKMRQVVLATVERLKRLFGQERRKPADKEAVAKSIAVEQKLRYSKADKMTDRLADRLEADVASNQVLPLAIVVHRITSVGRQGFDSIDKVLNALAQRDPAKKAKITSSILSWFTNKQDLAHMEIVSPKLRQNLESLLDFLQHG